MTMSTLMCPHCGGRLLIDPTQRLQSMLSCPYCGRKSLMQKKNGMIVLRGIISQATPMKTPADEEQALKQLDPDYRLHVDTAEHQVEPHSEKAELPEEMLEPIQDMSAAAAAEPVKEVSKSEIFPEEAEAEVAVSEEISEEPEPAADPVNDLVMAEPAETVKMEPAEAVNTEADISSLFSIMPTIDIPGTAEPSLEPVEAPLPEASEEQPAQPAIMEPIPDQPATQTPAQEVPAMTDHGKPLPTKPVLMQPSPEQPVSSDLSADKERLIALAARMAASGQIPAFNSYARRAIDCDPTDPRVYALRARLIEEAHGFARSTFLSPVWLDQTPRQKSWIIAQHFSSLNAAVTYSTDSERQSLAAEAGALIAWQIRETFVENARIRLGKRPFNGRFQRIDLRTAPPIIDACMSINETVVPHVSGDLLRSVRQSLAKLDPRLADRLQRIGF